MRISVTGRSSYALQASLLHVAVQRPRSPPVLVAWSTDSPWRGPPGMQSLQISFRRRPGDELDGRVRGELKSSSAACTEGTQFCRNPAEFVRQIRVFPTAFF
jgi:hypothetical protein